MKSNEVKKKLLTIVKVISTVLIASAIGLELGNIYARINHIEIPSSLNLIFPLDRFALISHFVEGSIVAFYAPLGKKMPLSSATYTFFVGTVGLLEMFEKAD